MKILLVAANYPPDHTVSALRVGKFAQHLSAFGHEVVVVAREGSSRQGGLEMASAPNQSQIRVVRTKDPIAKLERVSVVAQRAETRSVKRLRGPVTRMRRRLTQLLLWPDRYAFWARTARRVDLGSFRPDVVVASAPPLSVLLVGKRLAQRHKAKLVLDYRDLLSIGTYNDGGAVRRWVERRIEGQVARSASHVTTVSAPLADDLRAAFGVPASVVRNGFDLDDAQVSVTDPFPPSSEPLTLVYSGEIYPGKRDPSPLFQGMAKARHEGVEVRAHFFGTTAGLVQSLAARWGVADLVVTADRVPYNESLRLQASADALVLLMWNDPREKGVYSGKIFEYLSMRRPVVMLGYEQGVAADLIRERDAGWVVNDPAEIANILKGLAKQKQVGGVASLPESARSGLTRREQVERLEMVLRGVVAADS